MPQLKQMDFIDRINTARQKGANNDDILNAIIQSNPQIQNDYNTAIERGASSADILKELIKKNVPSPATEIIPQRNLRNFFSPEPTGESPYQTESDLTSPILPYKAGTPLLQAGVKGIPNVITEVPRIGKFLLDIARETDPKKNPLTQIMKTFLGATVGLGIKIGRKIMGIDEKKLPKVNAEVYAEQLGRGIYDSYGSVENFKRSLQESPITTISLVRGLMKSVAGGLEKGAAIVPAKTPTLTPLAQKTASGIRTGLEATKPSKLLKASGRAIAYPFKKGVEKIADVKDVGISPSEKTVLQQQKNPVKLNKYVQQAKEFSIDRSKISPLESAGKEAENALRVIDKKLKLQGQEIKKIFQVNANKKMPAVGEYKIRFNKEIGERVGMTFTKKGELVKLPGRKFELSRSDIIIVKHTYAQLKKLNPKSTLQEIEDVVNTLEDQLYKTKQVGIIPINTKVQGGIKKIIGDLNNKIKIAGGKNFSNAKLQYQNLIKTRNKLNNLLGPEGDRGGSLMKRVFTPSDAGTRRIFREAKKITNIDLIEEATLAKFAMEAVGDFMQKSLLEEIIKGTPIKKTITGAITNKILQKTASPIQRAQRIIEKTNQPPALKPTLNKRFPVGLTIQDVGTDVVTNSPGFKTFLKNNPSIAKLPMQEQLDRYFPILSREFLKPSTPQSVLPLSELYKMTK